MQLTEPKDAQADARLDELRQLLRQYPNLAPDQRRRLEQLFGEVCAAQLMVLLNDPTVFEALRAVEPPVDLHWGRALMYIAGVWVIATGAWLVMR